METYKIRDGVLEYDDETHTYIYEGVILPSITQILKLTRFRSKYEGINAEVLKRASQKGTAVHGAIEGYERNGTESELPELRGWKFIKKNYNINCICNEVPVVLFKEDKAVACGRLDMVFNLDNKEVSIADIKRTSKLDLDYLFYQLNLYRIAFLQSYEDFGQDINSLYAVHLVDNKRKLVPVKVDSEKALEIVDEYFFT